MNKYIAELFNNKIDSIEEPIILPTVIKNSNVVDAFSIRTVREGSIFNLLLAKKDIIDFIKKNNLVLNNNEPFNKAIIKLIKTDNLFKLQSSNNHYISLFDKSNLNLLSSSMYSYGSFKDLKDVAFLDRPSLFDNKSPLSIEETVLENNDSNIKDVITDIYKNKLDEHSYVNIELSLNKNNSEILYKIINYLNYAFKYSVCDCTKDIILHEKTLFDKISISFYKTEDLYPTFVENSGSICVIIDMYNSSSKGTNKKFIFDVSFSGYLVFSNIKEGVLELDGEILPVHTEWVEPQFVCQNINKLVNSSIRIEALKNILPYGFHHEDTDDKKVKIKLNKNYYRQPAEELEDIEEETVVDNTQSNPRGSINDRDIYVTNSWSYDTSISSRYRTSNTSTSS